MQLSDVKESGCKVTYPERDAERCAALYSELMYTVHRDRRGESRSGPAPRSSPGPTRRLAPLRSFCRSNLDYYLLLLRKYSSGTGSS